MYTLVPSLLSLFDAGKPENEAVVDPRFGRSLCASMWHWAIKDLANMPHHTEGMASMTNFLCHDK